MRHYPSNKKRAYVVLAVTQSAPLDLICEIMGIDYDTLLKYYSSEIEQGRQLEKTRPRSKLREKAEAGDVKAIAFFLSSRGCGWSPKRARRFVETLEYLSRPGAIVTDKIAKDIKLMLKEIRYECE